MLDRERAAAEERGKASVLLQAERDKGTMHEQLAFLKVQLQYALKVRGDEGSHRLDIGSRAAITRTLCHIVKFTGNPSCGGEGVQKFSSLT